MGIGYKFSYEEDDMTQPVVSNTDPSTGKQKWVWDKVHLTYIAGYAYGFVTGVVPVLIALLGHTQTNLPLVLSGLMVLLVTAVGGFFKNPPNSIESAIDAGKIAAGDAPQILAKRASLRPGATLPKTTPTIVDDPDKTNPL